MSDGDKTDRSGGLNQTGLWIALYNSALSGMCMGSHDTEEGPEEIAENAADVADAATKVVLERFELLNKAKLAPPG